MAQLLPIYTDRNLEIGKRYTTIVVDGAYFPVNEEFKLVNENNQVRATGRVEDVLETSFDAIGYPHLRNAASRQLQSWPNAVVYFSNRFKKDFSYNGSVQLVTFEVVSVINFDTPLTESVEEEKELGLPTEAELEGDNAEPSAVNYIVESNSTEE